MTRAELTRCERVIERGKQSFIEVGNALADIRDHRGYRLVGFKTFEEYCKVRWGWSRPNAAYYIDAAQVAKALPAETVTRVTVREAAELAKLVKPSVKGNGAPKEIDHDAVRAVVGTLDLGKTTVKQVGKAVATHLNRQRAAEKRSRLAHAAETFTHKHPEAQASGIEVAPGIWLYNRDARDLASFVSPDVDLVFTSPPYNQGIAYQTHDDRLSEADYTDLLRTVFLQCFQVMRDGARIGVNVPFGVNRSPYEPFTPRVFALLTDCGFTLLGQTVWDKGAPVAVSSTAWGSYASPSAPRMRDRCEAIVWAFKGSPRLKVPPGAALIDGDTYRLLSQDYWHVPPASDPEHPAIFPPALVENALRFYGYAGCHLLDPFAGAGNAGMAARALGCRASLVEKDAAYCERAKGTLACNSAV